MIHAISVNWYRRYGGRTQLGRFMSKIDYRGTGCWIWVGSKSDQGYGGIRVRGQHIYAHRLMFEAWYGPIPVGLELDHLCRVRSCVNPEHLEPVTRQENNIRSDSATALNARATHCPRGHEYSDANAYYRPDGRGINCQACVNIRSRRRSRLAP